MSAPVPPVSVSAPPPPASRSFSPSPYKVSASAFPRSTSLPFSPDNESTPPPPTTSFALPSPTRMSAWSLPRRCLMFVSVSPRRPRTVPGRALPSERTPLPRNCRTRPSPNRRPRPARPRRFHLPIRWPCRPRQRVRIPTPPEMLDADVPDAAATRTHPQTRRHSSTHSGIRGRIFIPRPHPACPPPSAFQDVGVRIASQHVRPRAAPQVLDARQRVAFRVSALTGVRLQIHGNRPPVEDIRSSILSRAPIQHVRSPPLA